MQYSFFKNQNQQVKKLYLINQPVFVRDIIIKTANIQDENTYADESLLDIDRSKNLPQLKRLEDHIRFLLRLCNIIHQQKNCSKKSGRWTILPEKINSITRLSLPEFSLYTKAPLTLTEFHKLYQNIEKMSKMLLPNAHILLSSFAVNWFNNLLNCVLYLEGGDAKIHFFAKNTASYVDPKFNLELFSQRQPAIGDENFETWEIIASENGNLINTTSVFQFKTVGGAIVNQAIDICFDHCLKHSKRQIERIISNSSNCFIPEQIEHCITSSHIDLILDNVISDKVIHIDPLVLMENYDFLIEKFNLKSKTIKNLTRSKKYKTEITSNYPNSLIINPRFGPNLLVETLAERPCGKLISPYLELVQKNNLIAAVKAQIKPTIKYFHANKQIGF